MFSLVFLMESPRFTSSKVDFENRKASLIARHTDNLPEMVVHLMCILIFSVYYIFFLLLQKLRAMQQGFFLLNFKMLTFKLAQLNEYTVTPVNLVSSFKTRISSNFLPSYCIFKMP